MTTSERLEELEAAIRRHMAEHAAIAPRGFDTVRARSRIHSRIDGLLDERKALLDGRKPISVAPIDDSRIHAKDCGICGRSRYKNFRGATICMACDGTVKGGKWHSTDLDDEVTE